MANFLESNITKLRIGARTNEPYIPDVNSPELLVDGTGNITTANINTGNIEIINGKTINIKDTNSNNVLVMNATSFTAYDNITIDANNVDIDKTLRIKRNNSLQDINTIITNEREAAKSYADGKVSEEAGARTDADTNLNNKINQEINDRSAAINQEVTDRNSAINSAKSTLQANINAETSARLTSDSSLRTLIDNMKDPAVTNSLQQQINDIKNNLNNTYIDSISTTINSISNSGEGFTRLKIKGSNLDFTPLAAAISGNHFVMQLGTSNYWFEVEYGEHSLTDRDAKYSHTFSKSFVTSPMVFLTWHQKDTNKSAREVFTTLRSVSKTGFEFSTSFSNGTLAPSNHSVQYLAVCIY